MPFDGFFTRVNNGFEAKRGSVAVGTRMGLADRKLPDGPSQEIKAHASLNFLKRVRNGGFAWFQFQPHAL
jgi:hypothetical protein